MERAGSVNICCWCYSLILTVGSKALGLHLCPLEEVTDSGSETFQLEAFGERCRQGIDGIEGSAQGLCSAGRRGCRSAGRRRGEAGGSEVPEHLLVHLTSLRVKYFMILFLLFQFLCVNPRKPKGVRGESQY